MNNTIDANIAFLCCARNVSEYITNSLNNLIFLGNYFKNSTIFIYENDSTDNTLDILSDFKKKHNNVRVFSSNQLHNLIPERTNRLAYIRNFLLNKASESKHNLDYICVADIDNVTQFINTDGFLSSINFLNNNKSVDAVFPTFYDKHKILNYYDKWALRYKNFDYNCLEGVIYMQRLMTNLVNNINKHQMQDFVGDVFLHNHPDVNDLIHKLQNNQLVKVDSAFGGMGIYKKDIYFCGAVYSGENKTPFYKVKNLPPIWITPDDCEHINFHQEINTILEKQAVFYINPYFIISESQI